MSKKIISVVLALALVMSVLAVSAFAVGGIGYEELDETTGLSEYTQTWALDKPVQDATDTTKWTVDVTLSTNYTVGAISFEISNTNMAGAVLTDALAGSALTTDYRADIQISEEFTETSSLVTIIPNPKSDATTGLTLGAGSVIATLVYTVAADATAEIAIVNDPKTAINNGGDLIAARLDDNNLTTATMMYGQTVTSVGEAQTLGAVAVKDPELVAKAGSTGFVDNDKMYVYGVPAGTAADNFGNYFEATNDGYFEMSVGAATATNGTGATLTLYNSKGEVAKTYTLVIFGDVNGDGVIAAGDSTAVLNHVSRAQTLTGANFFAADVAPDSVVAAGDSTVILNHVSRAALLSSNVWAA